MYNFLVIKITCVQLLALLRFLIYYLVRSYENLTAKDFERRRSVPCCIQICKIVN